MDADSVTPHHHARTVIHIGMGKTGTTFLQKMFAGHRQELKTAGWLYPGEKHNQTDEFSSVLGSDTPWGTRFVNHDAHSWPNLLKQINEWDGNVLLSTELLCYLTSDQIAKVLTALGRNNVDIVVTVRDMVRGLPSQLQQGYKSAETRSAEEFYERIAQERDTAGPEWWWWRAHRLPALVSRWREDPHVRSVTIVVNPEVGSPDKLCDRFLAGTGSPTDMWDQSRVTNDRANVSLTVVQARLLRSLNLALLDSPSLTVAEQDNLRWRVVQDMIRQPADAASPKLKLHRWHWRQVVDQWAKEDNAELEQMNVDAVGSLAELRPPLGDQPETESADPTQVPDVEAPLMAATVNAIIASYGRPAPITVRRLAGALKRRVLR